MAGKVSMGKGQDAFVSKGYSFASSWDLNATLTEQQQAAIGALSHAMADRPIPKTLVQKNSSMADTSLSKTSFDDAFQASCHADVILLNSHQFYKWFTELESAMKSEMEEKYCQYVSTLTEHLRTCDEILKQVDSTLNLFDELQAQHHAVATKTKTVHDACERLVMEKERLIEFADVLRNKLNYFDELENVSTQFYSTNISVGSDQFLPLLKRLDECISYVASNPQYADSGVYLVKFRQLQSRALGMVRSHVQSILKNASSQVQMALRENANGKTGISEGTETSILYVRFKAAANEMKPVMTEIEGRSSKKEYSQVLADCHKLYCEQRLSLVKNIVHQRISEYARRESLASLTRSGCAYLMQVCQLEHQLFDHFFPSSSAEISNLASLMDPLCTLLYDTLRPKFIHEADLDLLCELVDILKAEILEEQLVRRGDSVAGLRPIVLRILADVRERLIFRAQMYVRDEITNYLPSAEDLDYPRKLEQAAGKGKENESSDSSDSIETLYPPLEKTLSCLSKLYRCLEPTIFTGLAQDIVVVCSASLQRASKLIAKNGSSMDSQLFHIKHLLILREQIAPYDIEFAVTHKELDFSHLLDHLRRILKGQASIFDWTRSSSLARNFSPRVLQNQYDAKKELEKNLKSTCEEFIMAVTKLIVEPLLSFVTKVAAVKLADSENGKALRYQAFATPEKIGELIQKVDTAMQQELPAIIMKMRLYLRNPSTCSILFKPIKSNIKEAHEQLSSILSSNYSAADLTDIRMWSMSDLQAHLDGLL